MKLHSQKLGPKLIRTVIMITATAFAAFFALTALQMSQASQKREIDNQRSQLSQTAGRIRYLQTTIRNIASLIVYNDVVQKGISGKAGSLGDELYAARRISETLKEYLHILSGTEEITIYTANGQTLTTRYVRSRLDPAQEGWFQEFLDSGKTSGFTGLHDSVPMQDGYATQVFSYIMDYYSLESYPKKLGELIISVEYQTLLDMLHIDQTLLKGYALLGSDGTVLAQNGQVPENHDDVLAKAVDGIYRRGRQDIFVVSDDMEDGWVLVSEISGSRLVYRSLSSITPVFLIFVTMLAALALILRHMIRKVTDPINELERAVEAVGTGDFSVSVDIRTGDEVENLSKAFNRMVVDINELMNKSVEHEKKIQQMQTENLMLQINPHFIYNTMNSIVYMARMDGNTRIADFTNAFISLLQSTLRVRSSIYTTLGEELKNVRSYLFLQEYRYGSKFTYETICPPELEGSLVLSVMLQPVVENAIFHGIAPKEGTGHITIRAYREAEHLLITVADDGVGMSRETLAAIMDEAYVQKGGVHKIGVGNVRARIREVYGDPYTLHIWSEPGEGTVVTIDIPLREQEQI